MKFAIKKREGKASAQGDKDIITVLQIFRFVNQQKICDLIRCHNYFCCQ